MADCYYHGYSGGPGRCSQCEREERENLPEGTLGMTLEPDLVQDLANINSIGRAAAAKEKQRGIENKEKKDGQA